MSTSMNSTTEFVHGVVESQNEKRHAVSVWRDERRTWLQMHRTTFHQLLCFCKDPPCCTTPAFGRPAAVEARLDGEYRAGVGRVGRESEEIAFYDGGADPHESLFEADQTCQFDIQEDFVIKYLWSAAGYGLIAVPLLITRKRHRSRVGDGDGEGKEDGRGGDGRKQKGDSDRVVAARTETYISNRRLLLSLTDAGGRLMYAYKDLQEVAGLTGRLYTLVSTLHNLPPLPPALPGDGDTFALKDVDVCVPEYPIASTPPHVDSSSHPTTNSTTKALPDSDFKPTQDLAPTNPNPDSTLSGPNTTTLVRALTLTLKPGMHLMITGSNGVGKTAVARVLAGLWAPGSGSGLRSDSDSDSDLGSGLTRPTDDVDGRPVHLTIRSELTAALEELEGLLCAAHLGYLVEREGGWDTVKEWRDVSGGGEKQRTVTSPPCLPFPSPDTALECTSAVSSDVEGQMYGHAKALGITLITVSLRPSLTRYHTHILTLTGDGTGSWTFSRIAKGSGLGVGRGESDGESTAASESDPTPTPTPMQNAPTAPHTEDQGAKHLTRVLEEIRVLEVRIEESYGWEKRVRELGEALKAK
ncbi:uncharacterized protein EDB91DRAFT_1339034 [Suillus paluster]|uniref:uncharacterized protein n=1 Tax=Suillus paluster TaxID=48578 RepID=UPI001B87FC91|nr:uncharacterized protein EDB91DRAFT_1339034 [Suillus paluster]KAG1729533.1 hypothetical protein EDB91DRAFT_1339034 [Suillus paluster]